MLYILASLTVASAQMAREHPCCSPFAESFAGPCTEPYRECVATFDPFCRDTWDLQCVQEAQIDCNLVCDPVDNLNFYADTLCPSSFYIELDTISNPYCDPATWTVLLNNAWNRSRSDPAVLARLQARATNTSCFFLHATEYYDQNHVGGSFSGNPLGGDELYEIGLYSYVAQLVATRLVFPATFDAEAACNPDPEERDMNLFGLPTCCNGIINASVGPFGYGDEFCTIPDQQYQMPEQLSFYNIPGAHPSSKRSFSPFGPDRRRILKQMHGKGTGTCIDVSLNILERAAILAQPGGDYPGFLEGIFSQPGKSYSALMRMSGNKNFSAMDVHDIRIRGLALKVRDVTLPRIQVPSLLTRFQPFDLNLVLNTNQLADQELGSIDLLFIAIHNASEMGGIPINKFVGPTSQAFAPGFLFGEESPLPSNELTQVLWNPLSYTYGSGGAWGLGNENAGKFHLEPCDQDEIDKIVDTFRDYNDPDFLYPNLVDTLNANGIQLCLYVQPQLDPCQEVIEDTQVDWTSAPVLVGTVDVPQISDLTFYDEYCDNTVYHPFRTATAHKIIGSINRLRNSIYTYVDSRVVINGAVQTTGNTIRPKFSPVIVHQSIWEPEQFAEPADIFGYLNQENQMISRDFLEPEEEHNPIYELGYFQALYGVDDPNVAGPLLDLY